jgi:5-methylcytosine-specific restriction endonuclease McrA
MNVFTKLNQPAKGGLILAELLKIREHRCECCGLSEWNGIPITLQAHHKDGDKTNNELENLQLLCPNCHSQTDNYCSKNINKAPISDEALIEALQTQPSIRQALLSVGLSDGSVNYKRARSLLTREGVVLPEKVHTSKRFSEEYSDGVCLDCGKPISYGAARCHRCASADNAKDISRRPDRDTLKQQIRSIPFTQIGQIYGVSDNAVRKWCQFYELPSKKSLIKQYTEEEWATL